MGIISPVRICADCKQRKRVVAESLFANGLYGFYCEECDQKEREYQKTGTSGKGW